MNTCNATALIAEDEPVLARGLARTLGKLWPNLNLAAVVHNGDEAVEAALQHLPDVLFLDIQMPERNGLDAAEHIVDGWPASQPLPLIVFVTAFDRFAIDAFERAAVDYVLKPVEPQRLSLTCERLMQRLRERQGGDEQILAPLRALLSGAATSQRGAVRLTMIQAGMGSTLRLVPVSEVHYFEADDKYVRVVTHDQALLIRTPLRELLPRLDEAEFMQIHRGIVVRATLIDKVVREETGRIHLHMKGRMERLAVSRSYAHLFKPM